MPFDALSGNLAHSTRQGMWLGGKGIGPLGFRRPVDTISNNAVYKSGTYRVEQFEPCLRIERIYNLRQVTCCFGSTTFTLAHAQTELE